MKEKKWCKEKADIFLDKLKKFKKKTDARGFVSNDIRKC